MPEPPVPTLLALLLCDTVIQDAQTQKKSLIGVFGQIASLTFPTIANLSIFARLTDAEGNYRFRIEVVNLKDDKAIFALPLPGELSSDNQLGFVELVLNIQGLLIPDQGKYEFQLWSNDVYLGRTTLDVGLIKIQKQ